MDQKHKDTKPEQQLHESKTDLSNELDLSLSVKSSKDAASTVRPKSFGIRKSEVIMAQMTNWWAKGCFYFTIFLCMYIAMLENSALRVFTGYATDSYRQHSLMSTISVIRDVVGAASLPFFARLSDNFGRFELFIVAMVFRVIGVIIQFNAFDIERYAVGAVLYGFGAAGMRILWQINLSDASTLRWRLLAVGVLSMQTIVNTWSSGEVTSSLLKYHDWRFGIGMWAFITPLVCLPYMVMFLTLIILASKTDVWREIRAEEKEEFLEANPSARRFLDDMRSKKWYSLHQVSATMKYLGIVVRQYLHDIFWKVDFIGCLFIAVGFGLILAPLTLAGGHESRWQDASTIIPLVFGFLTIPLFVLWETKVTKRPMLPFKVMKNRGVWAGFLVGIFANIMSRMPNAYAYPVLLVGMNASEVVATRTPQLGRFVEGIAVPILGFVLARVRRTKGFVLFGNCVMCIAMGVFVHFRGSNDGLRDKYFRDGVAIGMCLLGFATMFYTRVVAVSVQACTNHEYMAIVTSIFAAFYRIGSAAGSSISGAIWTQDMHRTIRNHMVNLGVDPSLANMAYESPYRFIDRWEWGTPARRAVSIAYAEIQKKLCITGLCLCAPMFVWIFLLRDHRLADAQNLDDEVLLAEGKNTDEAAERKKSQVVFTDDKDYIMDFVKKIFGRKASSTESKV